MYLSEVSPVRIRGTVVAIFVVVVTFGQLFASIIVLALEHNWRLMLGLAAIPSFLQGVFMIFMPES